MFRMIYKKRGNIFESLDETNEDESATFWDQGLRKSDLEDFKTLEKRLEKIGEDSSEVKEELQHLRGQVEDLRRGKLDSSEAKEELNGLLSQVEEVKRYFEEDCTENARKTAPNRNKISQNALASVRRTWMTMRGSERQKNS